MRAYLLVLALLWGANAMAINCALRGTYGYGNSVGTVGALVEPKRMAITEYGIYVTDAWNNGIGSIGDRVQMYDHSVTYVRTIGSTGTTDGHFAGTYGIAANGGCIYVADGTERVQYFTAAGTYQGKYTVPGMHGGHYLIEFASATNELFLGMWYYPIVGKFSSGGSWSVVIPSVNPGHNTAINGLASNADGLYVFNDEWWRTGFGQILHAQTNMHVIGGFSPASISKHQLYSVLYTGAKGDCQVGPGGDWGDDIYVCAVGPSDVAAVLILDKTTLGLKQEIPTGISPLDIGFWNNSLYVLLPTGRIQIYDIVGDVPPSQAGIKVSATDDKFGFRHYAVAVGGSVTCRRSIGAGGALTSPVTIGDGVDVSLESLEGGSLKATLELSDRTVVSKISDDGGLTWES